MNSAASASDTRNKLNEEDTKRREELIRERDAAEKKDWDDNQAKQRPRKERRTYDYEDDVGSTAFPPDCDEAGTIFNIKDTIINLLKGIPTAERKFVILDVMSKYDAGSKAGDADTPPRIPVPVATWLASIHPALRQYAKGMHDFGYDDTFFIEGAPFLEMQEAFNNCNMLAAHRRMILDAKNLLTGDCSSSFTNTLAHVINLSQHVVLLSKHAVILANEVGANQAFDPTSERMCPPLTRSTDSISAELAELTATCGDKWPSVNTTEKRKRVQEEEE
jgi:hypothetical protein